MTHINILAFRKAARHTEACVPDSFSFCRVLRIKLKGCPKYSAIPLGINMAHLLLICKIK